MGKKSLLSRLLGQILKKAHGQRALRSDVEQNRAAKASPSAEKLLMEMKFGKR
jgi:hypothetical protein